METVSAAEAGFLPAEAEQPPLQTPVSFATLVLHVHHPCGMGSMPPSYTALVVRETKRKGRYFENRPHSCRITYTMKSRNSAHEIAAGLLDWTTRRFLLENKQSRSRLMHARPRS